MAEQRDFVASLFKTFSLDVKTLPSRIAFQKATYLLQELGYLQEQRFNFRWHNFGPYSSELARIGFSVGEEDISNIPLLNGEVVDKFRELIKDNERNSRFFEMLADIIYLKKNRGVGNEKETFEKMVEHRNYLNDESLFKLAIKRLSRFNLV